jgi:hypothetical protein
MRSTETSGGKLAVDPDLLFTPTNHVWFMEGGNKNKDDVHGMFIIHLPKTIYKYFLKESLKKETKLLTTTTRSSHRS